MAEMTLQFQNGKTIVVPFNQTQNIQLSFAPFIRGEGIKFTVTRSQAEFDATPSESILHWVIRV